MDSALHQQRCRACEGGVPRLQSGEIETLLKQLNGHWELSRDEPPRLQMQLGFRNYYETTAFVNAVAWIAHQQNHHPDISFSYRQCELSWTSYAAGGLTLNDFICAAQTDELLGSQEPGIEENP